MSKRKRIAALEREVVELRERIAQLEARHTIPWPHAPVPYEPWWPTITYYETTHSLSSPNHQ
jgi:hypothetical protein